MGALVRRSVGKGALRWGLGAEKCEERCATVVRLLSRNKGKAGGWAHRYRENGAEVRCGGGIGAEECEERCAAVGRFLSRNKGKVGGEWAHRYR